MIDLSSLEFSVFSEVRGTDFVSRFVFKNDMPDHCTFAYYLYCDKQRIHINTYSNKTEIIHKLSNPGVYFVEFFIKNTKTNSIKVKAGKPISFGHDKYIEKIRFDSRSYGIASAFHPVSYFYRDEYFEAVKKKSPKLTSFGTKSIIIDSGIPVDVWIKNSHLKNSGYFIVVFTGAVDRSNAKAPFFSGSRLSDLLGVPLVAFADPSLGVSEKLTLSWYAGNRFDTTFPILISKIISDFRCIFGLKPIVIGGSGGGFACLAQPVLCNDSIDYIAFNPQTSISRYLPNFVDAYINEAFVDNKEISRCVPEDFYRFLDEQGVLHDLVATPACENSRIFYLQNDIDSHVRDHALPYLTPLKVKKIGQRAYLSEAHSTVAYFGKWGGSHAPIPLEMLVNIVQKISEGSGQLDFLNWIEKAYPLEESFGLE